MACRIGIRTPRRSTLIHTYTYPNLGSYSEKPKHLSPRLIHSKEQRRCQGAGKGDNGSIPVQELTANNPLLGMQLPPEKVQPHSQRPGKSKSKSAGQRVRAMEFRLVNSASIEGGLRGGKSRIVCDASPLIPARGAFLIEAKAEGNCLQVGIWNCVDGAIVAAHSFEEEFEVYGTGWSRKVEVSQDGLIAYLLDDREERKPSNPVVAKNIFRELSHTWTGGWDWGHEAGFIDYLFVGGGGDLVMFSSDSWKAATDYGTKVLSLVHPDLIGGPVSLRIGEAAGEDQIPVPDHCDAALFHPREEVVALRYPDCVRVWNFNTAPKRGKSEVLVEIEPMRDGAHSMLSSRLTPLAFDNPCRRLLVLDGTLLRVIEIASRHDVIALRHDLDWVEHALFSPDGLLIAALGHKGSVGLWNASTGLQVARMEVFGSKPFNLSFAHDGRFIMVCIEDRIHVWSTPDGKPVSVLDLDGEPIQTARFTSEGSIVAASSRRCGVWIASIGPTTGEHSMERPLLAPSHTANLSLPSVIRYGTVENLTAFFAAWGEDVSNIETLGRSLLPMAVEFGREDIARWLLQNLVGVDDHDVGGRSALLVAVERTLPDLVRLLLAAGANPALPDNITGETPLLAALKATEDFYSRVVAGEVHVASGQTTAGASEALNTRLAILRKLLDAGAPADQINEMTGYFPLYPFDGCAEWMGSWWIACLVKHGANPDRVHPKTGLTPLLHAIKLRDVSMVSALLEAGADPTLCGQNPDITPLAAALGREGRDSTVGSARTKIVELLTSALALR